MASQQRSLLTPEEYLAQERLAEFKSEYYQGETFAMAGAKRCHNLISSNIVREMGNQLKAMPFEVYGSDMRVKVRDTRLYTYPDAVVACDEILFEDEDEDVLLNPVLIAEVLSKTTEAYDRGDKFGQYRSLDSLIHYLLVSQDRMRVEHYVRQGEGKWLFSELTLPDEAVHLPILKCKLLLAEVYDKVQLFSTGDAEGNSDQPGSLYAATEDFTFGEGETADEL